jgi:hypothetical protein
MEKVPSGFRHKAKKLYVRRLIEQRGHDGKMI